MRIKRFNTAITLMAIAVTGVWWNWDGITGNTSGGISDALAANATSQADFDSASTPGELGSAFANGTTEAVSETDFSPTGKRVTVIPWQNRSDKADAMPSQPVLQKWTVGKRVYYQMTGPVNPKLVGKPRGGWGSHLAYEAYFMRDGIHHDHWVLGPPEGFVGKYISDGRNDPNTFAAQEYSPIPRSRYRVNAQGDQISVTFWCYDNDTPGHIVFNYNPPNAPIQWVSTGRPGGRADSLNHRHLWWTNP